MKEKLRPSYLLPSLGFILLSACTQMPEVPRVPTPPTPTAPVGTPEATGSKATATPMFLSGDLQPGETLQISIEGLQKGE
jgi:hypothetical protein